MHVDTAPGLSNGLTPSGETTEIDQLKRYLRAIRLRWPILVVFTLLGLVAGWILTPDPVKIEEGGPIPNTYWTATHTLVTDAALDPLFTAGEGSAGPNLSQIAFLTTTGEVPVRVAERLGVTPEAVTAVLRVQARSDVSSLEITALGVTGDEAVLIADTTAAEIVDYVNEVGEERYAAKRDSTIARVDELEAERLDLELQLQSTTDAGEAEVLRAQLDSVINDYRLANEAFRSLAEQGAPESNLSTIEAAKATAIGEATYGRILAQIAAGPDYVPPSTTEEGGSDAAAPALPEEDPDPKVRAGIGGFMGLLSGLIVVLLLDRYDSRLRRRQDVEVTTGLPVLAEVPPLSRRQQSDKAVTSHASPRSATAEAFRVIRTAMIFSRSQGDLPQATGGRDSQVVMVTSASPGEGKTTTVANLASVLAEGGQSVLVVDCDYRRPAIEKYLLHKGGETTVSVGTPVGLTSPGSRLEATDINDVNLITGLGDKKGELKPVEIIEALRRIIEVARRHFDIVVLDTAPMLTTNDASDLMPEVDTVLFVVRNGNTRREKAFRACEFLRRLDAPALGVIFNAADETPATYYYYGYVDSSSNGKRRRRDRAGVEAGDMSDEPLSVN